jgi:hypothetical protein
MENISEKSCDIVPLMRSLNAKNRLVPKRPKSSALKILFHEVEMGYMRKG